MSNHTPRKLLENPSPRTKYMREWSAKNREHLRAWHRERYRKDRLANPEKWIARREYIKLKQRETRARNKEKVNERNRLWMREYYKQHPEKVSKWRKNNPDRHRLAEHKRRARKQESLGQLTSQEWDAIKRKQKWLCTNCKLKKPLTIDHIVPLARGGCHMAHNIQGLCLNCNCQKQKRLLKDVQFSLFDEVA